jgi:hypothetical protein
MWLQVGPGKVVLRRRAHLSKRGIPFGQSLMFPLTLATDPFDIHDYICGHITGGIVRCPRSADWGTPE